MNSRIILSTADFSANNIGRYVELSDLTRKVLAAQTQYDVDSAEAIALNTFLSNLTTGGFIGGDSPLLRTLFIPALASQHDELLIDLARVDGNGNFVNGMDSTELDAATTIKNFCVYRKDNSNVNSPIIGLSSNYQQGATRPANNQQLISTNLFGEIVSSTPYSSFSIVMYMPYVLSGHASYSIFENKSTASRFMVNSTDVEFRRVNDTQYKSDLSFTNQNDLFKGFNGFSYKLDGANKTFEATGDNISSISSISGSSEYDLLLNGLTYNKIVLSFMNSYGYNSAYSFFAGGDYLGSGAGSKLEELRGYVNTLMTALHVKD